MDDRDDLLDETLLRRSLRLEADERIPRFDAEAIAALARPRFAPSFVLGILVFAAALALTASTLWSFVAANAPTLLLDAIGVMADVVAALVSFLYPLVQVVMDPAVPLSLLAALAFLIYHEMRTRKEHVHVHAS